MIEKHTLMIGSAIRDMNCPTIISKVEQLHEGTLITCYSDSISYERIEGIPLTIDILEKCGFDSEKFGGYTYWRYGEALWSIRDKNDSSYQFAMVVRLNEIWNFDNEIKFLHQLQNLFFALTGNKLEVKI